MVMTRFRIVGYGLAVALTLGLAACGTPSGPGDTTTPSSTGPAPATELPASQTPTNAPQPSTTLDGVTATGAFGEKPTITFKSTPWAVDTTKVQVLHQGDGPVVPPQSLVQVNYYGVNGRTGKVFDESYQSGSPVTMSLGGLISGFQKGLVGQKEGTRLMVAIPGNEGYDANGGQTAADIQVGDTLVFVVDITRVPLTGPTGDVVTPTDTTLPTVTGDVKAPVLSVASGATPPTTLVSQPLYKGTGPKADKTKDMVWELDYAEYMWANGTLKLVRQTYGSAPLAGAPADLTEGWKQALDGQPMGTRLLLVVPPDLAYPDGYPKYGIPKGTTMVYVMDLLYVAAS